MKIIIAGAGAVGTHLAKLLSQENHDIVLIDEDEARLENLEGSFDLMTLVGSPLSVVALREAGTSGADLFIGVTPDEAHNLTCCILAHKMGAKKTVARVDTDEFTHPEQVAFFKEIGIDSIIYPEMLAGKEIMLNIGRSWIRQWWEVQNGELVLLSVKVRSGATIIGDHKPIREICGPDSPFHIVAIKRSGETIIPHGDDHIIEYDTVFFMTTPPNVEHIRTIAGKDNYPDVTHIVIVGGSDTAVQALLNMPDNMHAKLFETDSHRCEEINQLVHHKNLLVLKGDGTDIDVMEDENIESAQAFAALTDSSERNILACLEARQRGIRKTIAVIENTDYIPMAESLDIGTIINKKTFAASHIYRMMLKADVASVKTLTVANADVAEFPVAQGAKVTKHLVKDLGLPSNVNLGGLVRKGKGILINGNTQIMPGDIVVAFCLKNSIQKLEKYFK